MDIQGTFNTKIFFETLARIISNRENVSVTVTVTQKLKEKEKNNEQH